MLLICSFLSLLLRVKDEVNQLTTKNQSEAILEVSSKAFNCKRKQKKHAEFPAMPFWHCKTKLLFVNSFSFSPLFSLSCFAHARLKFAEHAQFIVQ